MRDVARKWFRVIPITALYGADGNDTATLEKSQVDADENQKNSKPDDESSSKPVESFNAEYVKSLRKESGSYRVAAKESDTKVKILEDELAKLKQAEMNDLEKAQTNLETETKAHADAKARADAAEKNLLNERVRNALISAAVEANFQDPEDATTMISQDEIVDDDGEISAKAVKAKLKALVDKKPYLVKTSAIGSGDGGAGRSPTDETDPEKKVAAYRKQMIEHGGRV